MATSQQDLGAIMPDFHLPSVEGGTVSLSASLGEHRGTLIVFWSGVCSHCRRYDGYLNEFGTRHPELALVVVAARQGESPEDLQRTCAERSLAFPILYDDERRIAHQWLVEQTPRVFLIDRERRLLYRGAIDNFKYPNDPEHQPYLESAIRSFLAGKPIARPETAGFGCAIESLYYRLPKPLEG